MYQTEQRNFLFKFFDNNPGKLFCAEEILDILEDETISRSTLYRNLSHLEKLNKIKKHTKKGSKKIYYQYMHGSKCKGKIHLHCTKCDNIFHMKDSQASKIVDNLSKSDDFKVDKTASTLYGICKNCQKLEKDRSLI